MQSRAQRRLYNFQLSHKILIFSFSSLAYLVFTKKAHVSGNLSGQTLQHLLQLHDFSIFKSVHEVRSFCTSNHQEHRQLQFLVLTIFTVSDRKNTVFSLLEQIYIIYVNAFTVSQDLTMLGRKQSRALVENLECSPTSINAPVGFRKDVQNWENKND